MSEMEKTEKTERTEKVEKTEKTEKKHSYFQKRKKKVCNFCVEKVENIDYKDIVKLRKYMTERAKIMPRRMTGTCSKHQRKLTMAIKKSRQIALLPFIND